MKLSVSLPDDDVAALDEYVREVGLPSRSAGVQRALRRLRRPSLQQEYAAAYAEREEPGEQEAWEAVVGDGIGPEPASGSAPSAGFADEGSRAAR